MKMTLTQSQIDGYRNNGFVIIDEFLTSDELERWRSAVAEASAAKSRPAANNEYYDNVRIILRDTNIAIAGGRPRGTLYGVYTFLEDYLGVRFLTIDHTHVPPVGAWRVVGPLDRSYRPPMSFRWSAYAETNGSFFVDSGRVGKTEVPRFAARLRCNTVTDQQRLGGTMGCSVQPQSVPICPDEGLWEGTPGILLSGGWQTPD